METDRHASDGEDRPGESGSTAHEESTGADGSSGHEYGYGADPLEAAGTGGPRAADSGAAPAPAGTDAAVDSGAAVDPAAGADPAGADPAAATEGSSGPGGGAPGSAGDPATGIHSATGLRSATAPRAVLRPIPEGFPTPPPRPARPNRRPAPRAEPSATPHRHRRLLVVGIAVAAALLLVVVVGGGILALRSFSPADSPTDPAPTAADDPGSQSSPDQTGLGSTEIGGAVVNEVSTEVGVRAVGASSSRMEPEGEYVIITFEVENPTSTPIRIGDNVSLETADGTYPVDREATRRHTAETSDFDLVPSDGSQTFHAVFDAPIGADPTGLHLELDDLQESGTLPLSG